MGFVGTAGIEEDCIPTRFPLRVQSRGTQSGGVGVGRRGEVKRIARIVRRAGIRRCRRLHRVPLLERITGLGETAGRDGQPDRADYAGGRRGRVVAAVIILRSGGARRRAAAGVGVVSQRHVTRIDRVEVLRPRRGGDGDFLVCRRLFVRGVLGILIIVPADGAPAVTRGDRVDRHGRGHGKVRLAGRGTGVHILRRCIAGAVRGSCVESVIEGCRALIDRVDVSRRRGEDRVVRRTRPCAARRRCILCRCSGAVVAPALRRPPGHCRDRRTRDHQAAVRVRAVVRLAPPVLRFRRLRAGARIEVYRLAPDRVELDGLAVFAGQIGHALRIGIRFCACVGVC